MGVYIFSWNRQKAFLETDEKNSSSSHDFGKDVILAMLAQSERVFAYRFEGYWKDAGTIDSLWEANMDLLNPSVPLELYDPSWKIYARNRALPPHYIGQAASVQNSMVTEGCSIDGFVDFSVLFSGVVVEAGAVVQDSIVMPGAIIRKDAVVAYSIIAENAVIGEGCKIGCRPENTDDRKAWGIAVVGEGVQVGDRQVVLPRAIVSDDLFGEVTA